MGMICQQLGVNHATAWRWMKAADEDEDEESSLKVQFRNAINDSGVALAKSLIENLRYQAGNGDTKANIFLLTHHPATRDHFSEAAATRKVEKRVIADVVGAIARSELTPESQTRLLLEIQALGHTLPPEGEG
jgi:hypothetical protein